MAPFELLWNTANDFHKNSHVWLNGPMINIDPEAVESESKARYKLRATSYE